MTSTIRAAPSVGASRGEAVIQPTYFTSSLFVDAFRADIREFERLFSKLYHTAIRGEDASASLRPFPLFKVLWKRLGWQWLHLKALEPRAREAFLNVTLRLFLECVDQTENFMLRIVGLFLLYTFYMSQPSTSVPKPIYAACGIPIPIDNLERLLDFPGSLDGHLKPYVQSILQTLRPYFLILPPSDLQIQNPRILPREEVRNELDLDEGTSNGTRKKKTGRPSKSEKSHKMRAELNNLDRWLEENSFPSEFVPGASDPAGAAGLWKRADEGGGGNHLITKDGEPITHSALSQRPIASLASYREKKVAVVRLLHGGGHTDAANRAGSRVLQRLKELDAAAAERGLEIGTEGGELSAVGRVEAAVNQGRVLSLLEGGGLT